MNQGPEEEIQVDRLALEGDGIGRLRGQVAFVAYSLPEEKIACRPLQIKKNHSRWLPVRLHKPSAKRIQPRCPYHFDPQKKGRWCGGCNWQHMTTAAQTDIKRQLVVETLERLGGVPNPPVHPTISSPAEWRYRNKIQVPFARDGKKVTAGFFAPESHDIVEFEDCVVQPESSVAMVRFVRRYAQEHQWPIYDEDAHRGWLRHLLIRMNEKGETLLALVAANNTFPGQKEFISAVRREFPAIVGIHLNLQPARTHAILGEKWMKLWGADKITESILGLNLSYEPGSFFQVNTKAAERLYDKAIQELSPDQQSVVLDLYCGVGAMTLLAARKSAFAYGIESVQSAVRNAGDNAQRNGIRNVGFQRAEVERALLSPHFIPWERFEGMKKLVLVDPPRSGCDPRAIQALLKLRPDRIVYVSCHPATLARDIKMLSASYKVKSVTPVDLFPQTAHIESVTRLERV